MFNKIIITGTVYMMLKNKFSEQILLQTKNCLPRAYRFYKLSRIITAGYAYRDVEAA